ncbi:MAG: shikimate dehydrogenase [Alloprevotella sp.]|nr:shikimate dehydrogenase [Alloprevotella sp.]
MARKFGLIGQTLGYSYSADYFNNRFEKEHIDAKYVNYELNSLDGLFQLILNQNLDGFNVTIPYKRAILPFLTEISAEVREIGAVNVVRVSKSGSNIHLYGYNTDAEGFRRSLLQWLPKDITGALVLGTGGAANAISFALTSIGLPVQLISRSARERILGYDAITTSLLKSHPLIVNTTPLGTWPDIDLCPPIPYELLTEKNALYDLVYNPSLTQFLRKGLAHGCAIKNGLDMLRLQADATWEIWQ